MRSVDGATPQSDGEAAADTLAMVHDAQAAGQTHDDPGVTPKTAKALADAASFFATLSDAPAIDTLHAASSPQPTVGGASDDAIGSATASEDDGDDGDVDAVVSRLTQQLHAHGAPRADDSINAPDNQVLQDTSLSADADTTTAGAGGVVHVDESTATRGVPPDEVAGDKHGTAPPDARFSSDDDSESSSDDDDTASSRVAVVQPRNTAVEPSADSSLRGGDVDPTAVATDEAAVRSTVVSAHEREQREAVALLSSSSSDDSDTDDDADDERDTTADHGDTAMSASVPVISASAPTVVADGMESGGRDAATAASSTAEDSAVEMVHADVTVTTAHDAEIKQAVALLSSSSEDESSDASSDDDEHDVTVGAVTAAAHAVSVMASADHTDISAAEALLSSSDDSGDSEGDNAEDLQRDAGDVHSDAAPDPHADIGNAGQRVVGIDAAERDPTLETGDPLVPEIFVTSPLSPGMDKVDAFFAAAIAKSKQAKADGPMATGSGHTSTDTASAMEASAEVDSAAPVAGPPGSATAEGSAAAPDESAAVNLYLSSTDESGSDDDDDEDEDTRAVPSTPRAAAAQCLPATIHVPSPQSVGGDTSQATLPSPLAPALPCTATRGNVGLTTESPPSASPARAATSSKKTFALPTTAKPEPIAETIEEDDGNHVHADATASETANVDAPGAPAMAPSASLAAVPPANDPVCAAVAPPPAKHSPGRSRRRMSFRWGSKTKRAPGSTRDRSATLAVDRSDASTAPSGGIYPPPSTNAPAGSDAFAGFASPESAPSTVSRDYLQSLIDGCNGGGTPPTRGAGPAAPPIALPPPITLDWYAQELSCRLPKLDKAERFFEGIARESVVRALRQNSQQLRGTMYEIKQETAVDGVKKSGAWKTVCLVPKGHVLLVQKKEDDATLVPPRVLYLAVPHSRLATDVKKKDGAGGSVIMRVHSINAGGFLVRPAVAGGANATALLLPLCQTPPVTMLDTCHFASDEANIDYAAVCNRQALPLASRTEHVRVLVLGLPGAGKTTLITRMKGWCMRRSTAVVLLTCCLVLVSPLTTPWQQVFGRG